MHADSTFVKNARKERRSDEEVEVLRKKKGKRNKPERSQRTEWETV